MTVSDARQDDALPAPTMSSDITLKIESIDRVHRPDPEDFKREYVDKRRPVVITGMMDHWPAMERWDLDYFRKFFGDLDVQANIQDLDSKVILGQIGKFQSMELTELFDKIEHDEQPNQAKYLRAYPVHKMLEHYPDLEEDYELPSLAPNWADIRFPAQPATPTGNPLRALGLWAARKLLNRGSDKKASTRTVSARLAAVMFVGSKGTITPFHTDGMQTSAYLCQVLGRKRCYFVSPDQHDRLYPRAFRRQFGMSTVDYRRPELEKHPKFRNVVVEETVLNPGEILYVPNGYWHAIESLDFSISYSHQVVNENNAFDWLRCIPERYLAEAYFKFKGGLHNITGAKDWDDWK
ncbi:cupin-like domain-containing protein [Saccharothrix sp. BKS2]|uniref:cupin-like domain-containing protein n=1 Tax=Saccharothrix sp. BKS2 TaxID=3064400 RepID=UPI0039EC8AE4